MNELFCAGFIELTTCQIFFHPRHTERSSKATAIGFFIDFAELGETDKNSSFLAQNIKNNITH
jgi:hypothetical protein